MTTCFVKRSTTLLKVCTRMQNKTCNCMFSRLTLILTAYYVSRCIRNPTKSLGENKGTDQLRSYFAVTAKLVSALVFATRIVQFLYFQNPKLPVSSHLLCLYKPGRYTKLLVFPCEGSCYINKCHKGKLEIIFRNVKVSFTHFA